MKLQAQLQTLLSTPCQGFSQNQSEISGDDCILTYPLKGAGATWTKGNLILRSVIYRAKDFFPVSLGFKKFFNWAESPDLDYTPFSMNANGGVEVLEKRDGSLLIVSQYKGTLIHRTRGTFDASALENGHEIEVLKHKFPTAFELDVDSEGTANYSLLFEWETPQNQIVIQHSEVNLVLIGGVRHEDYSYFSQEELDTLAQQKGLQRPPRYDFNSIKEMLNDVATWEGCEGVVVYSKHGQTMRKIKSEDYLRLHRLKSHLSSINKVVDFYVSAGCPSFEEAFVLIENSLDFEVAQRCSGDLKLVADAWENVVAKSERVQAFVDTHRSLPRKQFAELAFSTLSREEAQLAFLCLDGRELDEKQKVKFLKNEVFE